MKAYNKKDLFEKSIEAIEEHNLLFVEDIVSYLPCRKSTFYKHINANSDEMNELRGMLDDNKVSEKVKLRKKMSDSDNPTMVLSLYRLCATPEEHRKLNQQYMESKTEHTVSTDTSELLKKLNEKLT